MSPKLIRLISIFVGLGIFVLVVMIGFRVFGSRAADVRPGSVKIENISQNTAKITWSTDQPTIGAIKYGTSEGALNFYAPETLKDASASHSVELTLLSPGSMYYFQIQIGDQMFDNAGVSWTFSTKSKDGSDPIAPTSAQVVAPTQQVGTVTIAPSPIQEIVIPTSASTTSGTCTETDCTVIKAKLGAGCSVTDLAKNKCL